MSEVSGNNIIRSVRLEMGLTQREFARCSSLNPTYLCQVETGTHRIGREACLRIWNQYQEDFEVRGFTLEDLLACGRDAV